MSDGRVVQVNMSPGGLPKTPVEQAFVNPLGLDGDGHNEPTHHGGPHRAICLFGVEAIARLQAEGHPLGAGSVGENLTTEGIEWSLLPVGTRARVGGRVMLELASATQPCNTQRPNFIGGRFNRISIVLHPSDSRMYARVLSTGEVRPGDPIEILPPAEGSEAQIHLTLTRIDSADQESALRLWTAGRAAGHDVRILDDGELSAATCASLPGPAFNGACGLRAFPHLLPRVLDHFRSAGVVGWLPMETEPWPGAEPDFELAILAAEVDGDGEGVGAGDGEGADATGAPVSTAEAVQIRCLDPTEWRTWTQVMEAEAAERDDTSPRGVDPAAHLMATRDVHVMVAEEGGTAVGAGVLHVFKRVGLMRAATVVPRARRRGIQRRLIEARAALARELGCTLLVSYAVPDSVSERNLVRTGLERIWVRPVYRFDPSVNTADAP